MFVRNCLPKNNLLKTKILNNKMISPVLLALSIAAISPTTSAATPIDFSYQDWQVVCDNTRTCRLAGYQAENNSDFPVSVLLTRRAGLNVNVTGKVKLGGAKEGAAKSLMKLGNRHRISLFINDKDLGETRPYSTTSGDAALTASQVSALLDALTKSSKIELVVRNSRWQLSDKGATAVMIKADEAQGRVGTSSAFINPTDSNKANSNSILAHKTAPKLSLIRPNANSNTGNKRFSIKSSELVTLVQSTLKDASNECPNLTDQSPWRVSRLNSTQLLAQHSCWTGAYNTGDGMWLINDRKPYDPELITTSATDYNSGKISSVQKGRGIGDCLAQIDWIWTGKRFAKSSESTTGLCRMIEAGGAWQLPTYVTEVKIAR